jgi:hypothetical protein
VKDEVVPPLLIAEEVFEQPRRLGMARLHREQHLQVPLGALRLVGPPHAQAGDLEPQLERAVGGHRVDLVFEDVDQHVLVIGLLERGAA